MGDCNVEGIRWCPAACAVFGYCCPRCDSLLWVAGDFASILDFGDAATLFNTTGRFSRATITRQSWQLLNSFLLLFGFRRNSSVVCFTLERLGGIYTLISLATPSESVLQNKTPEHRLRPYRQHGRF